MTKQIKSKKRVVDYGEVYTGIREVNAMLDLVADEAKCITSTFLEPACGNGNFIIEILKRKMETVKNVSMSSWELAINSLKAVSSIYGVDIQEDNVAECKERVEHYLINEVCEPLCKYNSDFYEQWFDVFALIVNHNLIAGNTLTGTTPTGSALLFSEWEIYEDGLVFQKIQRFSDILLGEDKYLDEISYRNLCDFSFQKLA